MFNHSWQYDAAFYSVALDISLAVAGYFVGTGWRYAITLTDNHLEVEYDSMLDKDYLLNKIARAIEKGTK